MTTSPERIHARFTSPGSTVLSPIQRVRRWLCNVLAGVCAPLLVLAAISASAQAQTVTFAGTQTTIGSGWALPIGVAVDAAGNAFIADAYNNQVVEIPAGGGGSTTVGTGLNFPNGVAVDGAGNVFIADSGNNRIVELPAGGGAQTTLASGVGGTQAIAVDKAGDVFFADGPYTVKEIPTGGGAQTTVASGLNDVWGLAVDAAGDVFITDDDITSGNIVVEVPAGGGRQTTVTPVWYAQGLAVDAAGDLFIADQGANQVVEVPAGGGAHIIVGSNLSSPTGVAVDASGDVFITEDLVNNNSNTSPYTGHVVEVQPHSVNFGGVSIGATETVTFPYNVNSITNFGTPKVVTQGAPNFDYTLASGSTCIGTVSAGSTCNVNVTFAPLAPGLREGAVQLIDSSGNLLATTFVRGFGQGPAVAFGPGAQTLVPASGLNSPGGVAVDAAGDIFVADPYYNNRVVEVTPAGVQTTVGSGLNSPSGVAVDGAGDVFIADTFNNRVVEVTPAGIQTTVVSGVASPMALR